MVKIKIGDSTDLYPLYTPPCELRHTRNRIGTDGVKMQGINSLAYDNVLCNLI